MGFEVFLSFRGPDARGSITSYLYDRLYNNGIDTFRDDLEIRKGREIGPEIKEAIHGSKICIPIFSDDYASSTWCLDELAEMVDRAESSRSKEIILPIFYKITPGQVKRQTGSYEEAFKKHKDDNVDPKKIQKWREALEYCTTLSGYESNKIANGNEAELVREVVSNIKRFLRKEYLNVPDIVVDTEDYVKDVLEKLKRDPTDRKMVVLYGLGGVGKSTLASVVYNRICHQFEVCAPLKDVRELTKSGSLGLQGLQSQLISALNKESVNLKNQDEKTRFIKESFRKQKVLLLLDDISDKSQLDHLGGDPEYFGPGSRIIVTTRDRDILKGRAHVDYYEVGKMKDEDALRLFSMHAFGLDHPRRPFDKLSREIVKKTGRLPLAIEVIGSYLCEQEKDVWEAKLKELGNTPDSDVMKKLMISYDPLTPEQKQIFLDIACFLIGEDKDVAFCLWEDLKLYPLLRINELEGKCLVDVYDNGTISMHQQLRDMGRTIVSRENDTYPERTSRWRVECSEDKRKWEHSVTRSYTSKALCGVTRCFIMQEDEEHGGISSITSVDFKRYPNLRYLRMKGTVFSGDFRDCRIGLKFLHWMEAPQEFTVTDFNPNNLVILKFTGSDIEGGWVGWKHFKGAAHSLKVLNLSKCSKLTSTPDLSIFPNLERLIVTGCEKLLEIDPSVGFLSKLVSINIQENNSLRKLPIELSQLDELRVLILHRCSKVRKVAVSNGFLKSLDFLSAPCCESSSTPMASPEGSRFTISYLRDHFPLKEFKISLRKLQDKRRASESYQRWSRNYPEQVSNDAERMEELCQLQESGSHVPTKPSKLGAPCRIAILDRHLLGFYCRSHGPPPAPSVKRSRIWCWP